MLKTITNIDGSKVIAAIRTAKPVTATGKVAVENFSKFMAQNRLTALSLEQAIIAFEGLRTDVGITKLLGTLKGLMPTVNRKVACTYELVANEDKTLFLAAGTEAEAKIAELYKYNGDKIINLLVNGQLDAFATNPAVAELIRYAKAARADQANAGLPNANLLANENGPVIVTLVPVLNIAMLDNDNSLVSIDNAMFMLGSKGQVSITDDLSEFNLNTTVSKLLTLLTYLQPTAEPNVLTLKPAFAEAASKYLSITKFELDLLAYNDAFIGINGNFMSLEKAQAILEANRPEILAQTLLSNDARDILNVINELMTTLTDYRGALLTNMYAKKFEAKADAGTFNFYVIKSNAYYNLIVRRDDAMLSCKSYNDIMSMLADDFVATTTSVFNAMSEAYATDIESATSKMNVRVKLANDLADDISKLQQLYDSIVNEIANLDEMADANPAKTKALQELKQKTEDKLASAKDELSKLA